MIYDRCYPKGCAAPGEVQCQCNTQGTLSKLKRTPSQAKINVTSKSPVGDISVVTLIRTDTTLDHSQKAEKVCSSDKKRGITLASARCHSGHANWADSFYFSLDCLSSFPLLAESISSRIHCVRALSNRVKTWAEHSGKQLRDGAIDIQIRATTKGGDRTAQVTSSSSSSTATAHHKSATATSSFIISDLLSISWGPRSPQKFRKSH